MEKKVRVSYVAFDGEEFDTEAECAAHEDALQNTKGIIAFDEDKKVATDAEAVGNDAIYFFIENAEDARQTFNVLYDYYGTEVPKNLSDGDFLRYNGKTCQRIGRARRIDVCEERMDNCAASDFQMSERCCDSVYGIKPR